MKHLPLIAAVLAGVLAALTSGTISYMFIIASVFYLLVWSESY